MNILIAGELNVDLIMHNYDTFPALGREVLVENATLTLGSASAICAAGLARLGDHVTFLGKVGRDAWGDLCVDSLNNLEVDTSLVIRDASVQTGITVSVTSAKDRALVTYLGSMEVFCAGDIPTDAFAGCDHLHVSSFFLQKALRPDVKALLARAHAQGLTTSLDPGFDPEEKWGPDLLDTLKEVDVFLPNEVELSGITGTEDPEQGVRALSNGRTLIMAKLGSRGCYTVAPDHQVLAVPAFPVNAVDTTGAGDSFNAGFLHAWLRKTSLPEAMRFGCACGAISTTGYGGTTAQPNEAQANQFLQTHAAGARL